MRLPTFFTLLLTLFMATQVYGMGPTEHSMSDYGEIEHGGQYTPATYSNYNSQSDYNDWQEDHTSNNTTMGPGYGNGYAPLMEDDSRYHGMGFNMRNISAGPQVYNEITVDTSDDPFVNPGTFNRIVGGAINFVDDDNDGICDYVQDTPYFQGLGIGPFVDQNGDSIHDAFETFGFYKALGMNNFVDVDGDGLCDNYEENPWETNATNNKRMGFGPRFFARFEVRTDNDPFVNPSVFNNITKGVLTFVDDNNDGICDYVQDTPYFQGLGIGPFVDQNGDSIHDAFETFGFYKALGMNNFVDVDGDGLCDNYEENPWAQSLQ